MHPCRSAAGVVVHAPAKLNVFFEVLGKRGDGYHEIESLMCPIDLCDTLYFRDSPVNGVRLTCRRAVGPGQSECLGLDDVPDGAENLVVRAIELVRRRADVRAGADMVLIKRIPAAAGLGGGSSDAAAAILAANEVWGLGVHAEQLSDWAAELGSDVPFFLANGPAICRGRGELVEPLDGLPPLSFVVVRPPEGLATAVVYGACESAQRPRNVWTLVDALRCGDWREAGRQMWNRLLPAAKSLSPWVARLEREFAQLDFLGHGMSGSGTSYFGLCRHARHARRNARRLSAKGFGAVFAVRSCR
jgi:4-diphosphocytidyl-2-C-methyl-D-erythritol kinase